LRLDPEPPVGAAGVRALREASEGGGSASAVTTSDSRLDQLAEQGAPEGDPGADSCPPLRLPGDALAGIAIGFVTGFLGVGGGFLIVPTLAVGLAFTMRTAVGTSLAIITATSALGLAAHLAAGRTVDVPVTVAMALACAAGAVAGAVWSGRLPQQALGRGFAALVVAVAGGLVVSVIAGA
jgi:uncharacterized protein